MAGWGYQTRRGEDAPNSRLKADDRQQIKERRQRGETYERIARDLGVSRETVRKADQGQTYCDDD